MLTTDLGAAPGDIAQHLKFFNGVRSQSIDNVGIIYHRHQQQLVTSGLEMNGVQRQLVTIISLLMILLKVALVLLCLELSLISNVYVVVVLYPWMAHSKCVLVYFTSFTSSFSLLQYSASRTFLSVTR